MITNLSLAEIEVDAVGSTQVLVEIDSVALQAPARTEKALAKHFHAGEVSQATALARSTGKAATAFKMYPRLGVMLGTVNKQGLESLKSRGESDGAAAIYSAIVLSSIRPDAVAASAAPKTKYTWGLRTLKIDRLWKQGLSGAGVRVAHLDTGVDVKHAALKDAVAEFAEFDELGELKLPTPKPWDSGDHGTHTAATIAGRPVSGKHLASRPALSSAAPW